MLKTYILSLLLVAFGGAMLANPERRMAPEEYIGLVKANHPIARQAAIFVDQANYEVRSTRGAFDPLLKSTYSDKTYSGQDYWRIWQSSLVVPTWTGVNLKAAFDQTDGQYLDPEDVTPSNGLSYLGISVPLGQGLLIDARRAALLQAKQSIRLADADRRRQLNKLLLQATKDYWDWSFTYQRKNLHEESLRLATARFEAIRDRVLFGEQAAIDSLEAFIEVQNRQNIFTQSVLEEANARLVASNHLWDPQEQPVLIGNDIQPVEGTDETIVLQETLIAQLIDSAGISHPDVLRYDVRLRQLEIEKRWATEKLRPKLDLDYNFLATGSNALRFDGLSPVMQDNYKFGMSFSIPLFLREERGKVGMTKLKIDQTELEQQQVTRELQNLVRAAYNELNTIAGQLEVQKQLQRNADKLLEGELYRFAEGESFLFLVNNRENGVINSKIRLAELRTKFAKSAANVYWSAGQQPR